MNERIYLLIAIILILMMTDILNLFGFYPYAINSYSMKHTPENDLVFVDYWKSKELSEEEIESLHIRNGFDRGDIVVAVKEDEYNVGDVVVFGPNPIIAHRVYMINETHFTTIGDAETSIFLPGNEEDWELPEPLPNEEIIGKIVYIIPYFGYLNLAI